MLLLSTCPVSSAAKCQFCAAQLPGNQGGRKQSMPSTGAAGFVGSRVQPQRKIAAGGRQGGGQSSARGAYKLLRGVQPRPLLGCAAEALLSPHAAGGQLPITTHNANAVEGTAAIAHTSLSHQPLIQTIQRQCSSLRSPLTRTGDCQVATTRASAYHSTHPARQSGDAAHRWRQPPPRCPSSGAPRSLPGGRPGWARSAAPGCCARPAACTARHARPRDGTASMSVLCQGFARIHRTLSFPASMQAQDQQHTGLRVHKA